MKMIAVFLGAAAISISGSPLFAQQAAGSAQTNASVNAGGTHVSQSTDVNASASADRSGAMTAGDAQSSARVQMHPVNGELVGKLDSKTARSGDTVVVKTSEAFRTSEGIVVPKGSRLVGHVTEVQAHGNGNQDSHMGIEFDRAELKNGQSVAMHSVIESVAPPANAMAAASMDTSEDVGVGGGRAMGGGGRSGGGLLGGASGATAGIGSGLGRTVGGSVDAASNVTRNAGATVGNSLNGAAGATGSLGAHATAIPGVMLEGGAAGSTSGVLSASKHNVHLDSGTQMTLGVAGAVAR